MRTEPCTPTRALTGLPDAEVRKARRVTARTWSVPGTTGLAWAASLSLPKRHEQPDGSRGPCASRLADGGDAPAGCRIACSRRSTSRSSTNSERIPAVRSVQERVRSCCALRPAGTAVGYNPLDHAGAVGRFYTVGIRHTFWRRTGGSRGPVPAVLVFDRDVEGAPELACPDPGLGGAARAAGLARPRAVAQPAGRGAAFGRKRQAQAGTGQGLRQLPRACPAGRCAAVELPLAGARRRAAGARARRGDRGAAAPRASTTRAPPADLT